MISRGAKALAIACIATVFITPVAAAEPVVAFDVGYAASAVPYWNSEAARLLPGESAFQARVIVSTRLVHGVEADLSELTFAMVSHDTSIRIVDWSPHTSYAEDVSGQIDIVLRKKHEQSHAFGAEAGAPFFLSGLPGSAAGSAHLDGSEESTTEGRFSKLPPKDWIIASGTTQRARGVFFKMRPHSQATLEGSHVLTITFAAPSEWKASPFEMRCVAASKRNDKSLAQVCGLEKAYVGVYLANDAAAYQQSIRKAEQIAMRAQLSETRAAGKRKRSSVPKNPLNAISLNIQEAEMALRPLLKLDVDCECLK